jgi:hypothetical protein
MSKQLTISLPSIAEELSLSPIKLSPFNQTSALFPGPSTDALRPPLSPLNLINPDHRFLCPTPPCSPASDPVERAPVKLPPTPTSPRINKRKAEVLSANDPRYPDWLVETPAKPNYKYDPTLSVHQALFLWQNDLSNDHILQHSFFCKFQYCPFHHTY